ncbi:MAG: hypothetical protein RI894_1514 [Bacteroidota bacterium]
MKSYIFLTALIGSAMMWQACKNTPSTTASSAATPTPDTTTWLVVAEKGGNLLFGKKIDFDNLPKLLQDTLQKLVLAGLPLPQKIRMDCKGEVLMGQRGEAQTLLQEALDAANVYKITMSIKSTNMVENFYAWYLDKLNNGEGYSLLANEADAKAMLAPELYQRLLKQEKDGELDADYFIQAQDFDKDWGNIAILDTKQSGEHTTHKIQLGNAKKEGATGMGPRLLNITVVSKKTGWQIEKVEAID